MKSPRREWWSCLRPEMVGQLRDPRRQERDLDLRRAGVPIVDLEPLDDIVLLGLLECHPAPPSPSAVARTPGARRCCRVCVISAQYSTRFDNGTRRGGAAGYRGGRLLRGWGSRDFNFG